MATFLSEDNKQLLKKSYKLPKGLKDKLSATLAATKQYSNSIGHKRLEHLVNDDFNDRSKGKETQSMKGRIPFGLLKRWQNAFKYTQPNGLEYHMLGGEDMKNWVNGTINRERTMVKPVLPQKDNNTPKPSKPKANTKKPLKIEKPKLHIHESSEHEYYEYMRDYDVSEVFRMYQDGDKPWVGLINPESYHQALKEFTKYGKLIRFPKQKIYQWFGTIMRNTAILTSITEIAGHSTYSPLDEFLDAFFYSYDEGAVDYDAWEKYKTEIDYDDDYGAMIEYLNNLEPPFFNWCRMPDGSDPWSDFGIEPLEKIINEYNENKTAEEVLVLLNRALDVAHCRGDLASIFIVGGCQSLTQISEEAQKNKKSIIISENQLNKLKQLLDEGRNADKAKAKTLEVIRDYFNNASWLDNEFQDEAANPNHLSIVDYIENKLRELCFHANIPDSVIRLEPIIMNIALRLGFEQGSIEDTQKLNRLFKMVEFIKNGQQKGNLPIQLNKLTLENTTYDSLNNIFGDIIDNEARAEKERIESANYSEGMNPNYKILSDVDYETAHKYGEYSCSGSKLCYTQSENTWQHYTKKGLISVYLLLRNDWQEVPEVHGENTPYDDYGLSMIFLFIDEYGDLVYSNTRWNHDTRGQGPRNVDQSFTKEQISQLLNVNFNQVFKQGKSWEDLINNVLQRLHKGEPISSIFDYSEDSSNGLIYVELKGKLNYYNQDKGNFISEEWFESMGDFHDGLAVVGLKDKENFITEEGKLLSPIWFDYVSHFEEDRPATKVKLDSKYNLVTKEGKLVFDPWLDYIGIFNYKGYAKIALDDAYNIIDINGKILSPIWFDEIWLNLDITVEKYNKTYIFNPKTCIGLDLNTSMVKSGLPCSVAHDFKIQKENFYIGDGHNDYYLFPSVMFDFVRYFSEASSNMYDKVQIEINKLNNQLDNVRTNRDYDYLMSEINRLKTEAKKCKFRALVGLEDEKYFIDLNGNLFSATNPSEHVGKIPSNIDEAFEKDEV